MSYPQPPVTAQPPAVAPSAGTRPTAVTAAVALLWTMAVAGLAYAVGMVAVVPSTVSRFRAATAGSETAENFIAVVWLDATVAAVVALLAVALFLVLGVGLRRGSRVARGVTLGVCALGMLAGCGSLAAIGAQRAGEPTAGSLGEALGAAYPNGWISLNVAVAVAQVIAYSVVAVLLLAAPRPFFGGGTSPAAAPPHPAFGYPPHPSGQWAAPQSPPSPPQWGVAVRSEGDQKPASGSEDEFWSRPSD